MALLDNRDLASRELALKDGVLKTDGALVSMSVPNGWSAKMLTSGNPPGMPPETLIILKKSDGLKISIGVYFSGVVYEEIDGRIRKESLFDQQISMKAGTPEATSLIGGEGALASETKMQVLLLQAGRHGVQSDEAYCRAIKTTEFNGLKCVIYEFQNESTGTRAIEYCIDVLGNGCIVYALYYRAPIETFAENMDTAVEVFKSSVWRKDFDPYKAIEIVD